MRPFLPRNPATRPHRKRSSSIPTDKRRTQGSGGATGFVYFCWTALSLILLSLFGSAGPRVSARTTNPTEDRPAVLLGGNANENGGEADKTREYQVKAGFLKLIIGYTTWPKEALPPKGQPIIIAVIGKNPFGKDLDTLLKNAKAHGYKLEARYFAQLPAKLDAQLAFIAEVKEAPRMQALKLLKGKPILVVGEHTGYALAGAQLNFYIDSGRVRFESNLQTLADSKLKMSSQFLKLSRVVKKKQVDK